MAGFRETSSRCSPCGMERLINPFGSERKPMEPYADGGVNRVGDRRCDAGVAELARHLRAERTGRIAGPDQDGPERRHVGDRRELVLAETHRLNLAALVERDLLHEGAAEPV